METERTAAIAETILPISRKPELRRLTSVQEQIQVEQIQVAHIVGPNWNHCTKHLQTRISKQEDKRKTELAFENSTHWYCKQLGKNERCPQGCYGNKTHLLECDALQNSSDMY